MALNISNWYTGAGAFSPNLDKESEATAAGAKSFAEGLGALFKRNRAHKRADAFRASYGDLDSQIAGLQDEYERLYNEYLAMTDGGE